MFTGCKIVSMLYFLPFNSLLPLLLAESSFLSKHAKCNRLVKHTLCLGTTALVIKRRGGPDAIALVCRRFKFSSGER